MNQVTPKRTSSGQKFDRLKPSRSTTRPPVINVGRMS